jgi:hypothetical protein
MKLIDQKAENDKEVEEEDIIILARNAIIMTDET